MAKKSGFTPTPTGHKSPEATSFTQTQVARSDGDKASAQWVWGFTLIEVLVSIFVVSTVLVAILSLFSSNIRTATVIKNNFLAASFAQEGVEIMNNLRNEDWIAGRPFGSFGNPAGAPDDTYRVQWNSDLLLPLGADPVLLLDNVTGLYSYDSGSATAFKRTVAVETVMPGVEKRITVTVTWPSPNGQTQTLSVESHLFNWR